MAFIDYNKKNYKIIKILQDGAWVTQGAEKYLRV